MPEENDAIVPQDAASIWNEIQRIIAQQPPLIWVRELAMVKYERGVVTLGARPGRRDVLRFLAAPARRDQLAALFKQVVGQTVRIELGHEPSASAAPGESPGPSAARGDRSAAYNLPLVKQISDLFDVTLIDAHPERAPAAPAPPAEPVTPAGDEQAPSFDDLMNEGDIEPE